MSAQIAEIPFHGAALVSIQDESGTWVSLNHACDHIGVSSQTQVRKLKTKRWAHLRTDISAKVLGQRGVNPILIHMDSLPMWLATIEAARVGEHARPMLEFYQDESAKALADYWNRGVALNPDASDEQKEAAAEKFAQWFSARRLGIDTRKDFVSMIRTLNLAERYPDAYRRSTRDLYNRLFNNSSEGRDEILQDFIAEKGSKSYVDPDGKRRSYNYRDTLTEQEVSLLEDVERRVETAALALHEAGHDAEEAYSRARDGVLRKMGNKVPF